MVHPPALLLSFPFPSDAPGAPRQRQAGPALAAPTCPVSSAAAQFLFTAPAPKVSPCCRPLPDLQCFPAVDDPDVQPAPSASSSHRLFGRCSPWTLSWTTFVFPPCGIWPLTTLAFPPGLCDGLHPFSAPAVATLPLFL